MQLHNVLQLKVLFLATIVYATQLLIFARSLDDTKLVGLGSITVDGLQSTFEASDASLAAGSYCVGTDSLPEKECFAYLEVGGVFGGEFVVYVDGNEVIDLTFAQNLDNVTSRVASVGAAAEPIMKPHAVAQKVVTQKVKRKVLVENENGEQVEIEREDEEIVEPDNRSWVQKNWLYLALPLVLIFIMAPEEKAA